jgi:hypothetical protein
MPDSVIRGVSERFSHVRAVRAKILYFSAKILVGKLKAGSQLGGLATAILFHPGPCADVGFVHFELGAQSSADSFVRPAGSRHYARIYHFSLLCGEQKTQNKQRGIRRLNRSKASCAISNALPCPDFLRYYPDHRLIAWQSQGALDDLMLNEIAEWLVDIEKPSLPFRRFKRFVDLTQWTIVAVRTNHVFLNLRERERSSLPQSSPRELPCFPLTGSPLASRLSTNRWWKAH